MDPELLDLIARIGELNDEELTDLHDRLLTAADALLDDENPSDETLEALDGLRNGLRSVRDEQAIRTQAAADRAARRQEIADEIRAEQEPAEGETPAEGESEEQPQAEGETPAEGESEEQPQAVAAAAGTPAPRASITRMAARRPAAQTPRQRPPAEAAPAVLVASANVPGIPHGEPLETREQRAAAFLNVWEQSLGYNGPAMTVSCVRAGRGRNEFPEDRWLDGDVRTNERKLVEALPDPHAPLSRQPQAVVASGGFCAPLAVSYDLAMVSVANRPARDGLDRFGADRGGVRYIKPFKLTDVDGAIGIHTNANDVSGTSKPVLTISCGSETTVQVQAITRIVKFGNFNARTFPEQVDQIMGLTAAAHARHAERAILDGIAADAGTTHVSTGQLLGTTRDVLAALDRLVAAYRNRHRMDPEAVLNFWYPDWLDDQIRADLAREMPGSYAERLATADAEIDAFFRVRSVRTTKLLDGETGSGQDFGPQGTGPVAGWPTNVITYLFHAGAIQFLDGGTLDLGIVRDSTLNNTNDFEMFMETFEAIAVRGVEVDRISLDVCPSGEASALATINPCSTGS